MGVKSCHNQTGFEDTTNHNNPEGEGKLKKKGVRKGNLGGVGVHVWKQSAKKKHVFLNISLTAAPLYGRAKYTEEKKKPG